MVWCSGLHPHHPWLPRKPIFTQVRNVAAEQRARDRRGELARSLPVEHMVLDVLRLGVQVNGRGILPRPHPHGPEATAAAVEDGPDRVGGDTDAFLAQDRRDLVPAGHALLTREHTHHVRIEHVVTHLGRRRNVRPQRAVERGPRDLQLAANPVDGKGGPLRQDKQEIFVYRCFAAKKALTFPRNSISLFSSALSACKALYLAYPTGPGSARQHRARGVPLSRDEPSYPASPRQHRSRGQLERSVGPMK